MFEVALPDLGTGVSEGEVLEWHVAPGDVVAADDALLDVETEKATVEVPSPVAGRIDALHANPGDVVETDAVLVTIETEDAEAAGRDEPAAGVDDEPDADDDAGDDADGEEDGSVDGTASQRTSERRRVFAPPSVRRLARELGVALEDVSGSGPGGRVTEGDVRSAGTERSEASEDADGSEQSANEPKSAVRRVGSDERVEAGDGIDSTAGKRASEDEEGGDGGSATTGDGVDDGSTDGEEVVDDEPTDAEDETDAEPTPQEPADPAVKSAVRSTGSTADRERTLATPATRRLARELDVDLDAVPTDVTRDGEPFVDEAAVRASAERREASREASQDATGATPSADPTSTEEPAVDVARTEAYRGTRRRIGERAATSRREVPHATHHDRVEVSELVAARERLEPLAAERGVTLTITPFVLKCLGAALEEHPVLNTRFDADAEEIHYCDEYHVGVATDTDQGTLVPVVRDVADRGIVDLAVATNDLVARARDGSIDRRELQGATVTVENVGAIGGEYADPIVAVPQTAVLSIGALRERPVAEDGVVTARPTLPLSLATDRRVIDGADSARFTNTLQTYLADPTRLLLE